MSEDLRRSASPYRLTHSRLDSKERDLHLDVEHLSDLNTRLELKLIAKGKINQVNATPPSTEDPKKVKPKVPKKAYGIEGFWGLGKKALIWAGFLGGSPPILPGKTPSTQANLAPTVSGEMSPPQEAPAGTRASVLISPRVGLDPFATAKTQCPNPAAEPVGALLTW